MRVMASAEGGGINDASSLCQAQAAVVPAHGNAPTPTRVIKKFETNGKRDVLPSSRTRC